MKRESRVDLLTWHVLALCLVVSFPSLCKTTLLLLLAPLRHRIGPARSGRRRIGSCDSVICLRYLFESNFEVERSVVVNSEYSHQSVLFCLACTMNAPSRFVLALEFEEVEPTGK